MLLTFGNGLTIARFFSHHIDIAILVSKTGTFQTVSPYQIPGTSQQRLKVIVQGKQSKPVADYLVGRGIPKKWVEITEIVKK